MDDPDREVLQRLLKAARRDRLLVTLAAAALGTALGGVGLIGPILDPSNRREYLAAGGMLGAVWLALTGLAALSATVRIRRLTRDLDAGRVERLRTRMKRCWEMGDIEDGPRTTQWVRCDAIRGPLLVPGAFHRKVRHPQEVELLLARRSRVVLQVDGRSIWDPDELDSIERIDT